IKMLQLFQLHISSGHPEQQPLNIQNRPLSGQEKAHLTSPHPQISKTLALFCQDVTEHVSTEATCHDRVNFTPLHG
ncbi:MAG: hypothetical protein WBP54_06110, partial [Pelodictyon phaeoclathratiforme]